MGLAVVIFLTLWVTACVWADNSATQNVKQEHSAFHLDLAYLGPPRSALPPPPTPWSLPEPVVPTNITLGPFSIVPELRPDLVPLSGEKAATPQASPPAPAQAVIASYPTPTVWAIKAIAVPTPVPTVTPAQTPPPASRTSAPEVPTPTTVPLHTPTPAATVTPTPTITPAPELTVPLVLETYSPVVRTGQEFQLTVKVQAGHTLPVDTAQAYLDFDPAILEVVNIRPGPHLGYLLQSSWDNSRGRLAYAAGTLRNPLEFPFTLCNVVFRAKTPTVRGSTLIQFDDQRPPRQSKAIHRGLDVTGRLVPARVQVR